MNRIEAYEKRSDEQRRLAIIQYETGSEAVRQRIMSEEGTRAPVLASLPYYDTIRMGLFDGAHCLRLGKLRECRKPRMCAHRQVSGLAKTQWMRFVQTSLRPSTELTKRERDSSQTRSKRVRAVAYIHVYRL